MPTKRLTDEGLRKIRPPSKDRAEIFDSKVPGLAFRVTDNGVKSWSFHYRINGKRARFTIGRFETYPVKDARERAKELRKLVDDGVDPMIEKRARRHAPTDDNTVKAAVTRWLSEEVSQNRASTQHEWKRIFDTDILPRWGARALKSITQDDVFALRDAIRRRGAEVQSNRVLSRVGRFLNWCVEERLIPTSPAANVPKRGAETPRDRVLSDAEIVLFWNGCGGLGWPFGDMFRLLLVTAQRRDEVAGLALPELDLEKRTWTIPGERAKNGRVHEVALSDLALSIIAETKAERPQIEVVKRSPLLFTTNGATAPSGFSRAKLRLDASMEALARKAQGLPEDDEGYRKALGLKSKDPLPSLVPDWILHDLRRTAASGMARIGIGPHVVDKILNHISGTIRGVAAVYNRHAYTEERAAALETWGRYLTNLIEGRGGDNVVRLGAAR